MIENNSLSSEEKSVHLWGLTILLMPVSQGPSSVPAHPLADWVISVSPHSNRVSGQSVNHKLIKEHSVRQVMCFRLRNMSLFCKDKKKGNVNILFSYLMSEKIWITFCNVFVFHQYTIHLFYLKHFDIKNMKVKCAIERQPCFSFFHVRPFSIQFQTNCHLNYIFKNIIVRSKSEILKIKRQNFKMKVLQLL